MNALSKIIYDHFHFHESSELQGMTNLPQAKSWMGLKTHHIKDGWTQLQGVFILQGDETLLLYFLPLWIKNCYMGTLVIIKLYLKCFVHAVKSVSFHLVNILWQSSLLLKCLFNGNTLRTIPCMIRSMVEKKGSFTT